MKKVIILLIVVFALLSSVACLPQSDSPLPTVEPVQENDSKETDSQENKEKTLSEARQEAIDYLNSDDFLRRLARSAPGSDVVTARIGSIGTFIEPSKKQYDVYAYYGYSVKGSFYGYDSYGRIVDVYNFSTTIKVYTDKTGPKAEPDSIKTSRSR